MFSGNQNLDLRNVCVFSGGAYRFEFICKLDAFADTLTTDENEVNFFARNIYPTHLRFEIWRAAKFPQEVFIHSLKPHTEYIFNVYQERGRKARQKKIAMENIYRYR
jgi:hypothetical protein